jgi:hypothetical protein
MGRLGGGRFRQSQRGPPRLASAARAGGAVASALPIGVHGPAATSSAKTKTMEGDDMRRLSLDEIAPLAHGAVGLRREDDGLQPIRLPVEDMLLHHPALRSPMTAEAAAGVRLRLRTDTDRLRLEVEHEPIPLFGPMTATPCAYDLVTATGEIRRVAPETDTGPATIEFTDLGGAPQLLEIWLPQGSGVRIRSLAVDAAAMVEPAADDRPHWVTYGSSITHCAWVPGPTQTWPSIVARALGWRLTCLGFNGGCHIDPLIARAMAALDADRFTLKLGINVHNMQTLRDRTFGPLVQGFIATLRDRHPTTPITVISPIISPEREDSPISNIPLFFGGEPLVGDLSIGRMREVLREAVEARRAQGDFAIDYLDGRELFGEGDLDLLPDGLHPSTEGYALMGERFIRRFGAPA